MEKVEVGSGVKIKQNYLRLLRGQEILFVLLFSVSIVNLVLILVRIEFYQLLKYAVLVVFLGCLVSFVGLVVYTQPMINLFKKIELDEKRAELLNYSLTQKKIYTILFYAIGILIGLSGVIYELILIILLLRR